MNELAKVLVHYEFLCRKANEDSATVYAIALAYQIGKQGGSKDDASAVNTALHMYLEHGDQLYGDEKE